MLLAISTAQHTHRVFPDQLASKHDRDTSSPTTPSERWLELLRLHNTARRVREKQPLRLNEKLGRAAQRFAECMARIKKYDHDADGRSPAERIEAEGYLWSSYSENIGWSIRSDREAFDTWMNSASHRENIFGRETEVGFGSAQGVYVAVYASPR